jgi:SAM-dependent methyltransferase
MTGGRNSGGCLFGCTGRTAAVSGSYLRCLSCGLVFDGQPPGEHQILDNYRQDLYSPSSYYQETTREDRWTFRRRLRLLKGFHPARGRLLDIGCATGTLMEVARDLGWQVTGIDPNPKALTEARRRGLTVHQTEVERMVGSLPGEKFDCIVMSEVLEHLLDPVGALAMVQRLLAPGGHVMVSTPNTDSLLCRLFQLKPAEHLFLFNRDNLRTLFERSGFGICHLRATSRLRALSRMDKSTTHLGPGWITLLGLLQKAGLDGKLARVLFHLFGDELFLVARKNRAG